MLAHLKHNYYIYLKDGDDEGLEGTGQVQAQGHRRQQGERPVLRQRLRRG